MRGGPVFLGVYAKAAELEKDGEKNATRWHVWGLADGGFMLQEAPVEAAGGPGRPGGKEPPKQGEPRRLSPDEFFLEYRVLAAFSPQKKSRKAQPEAPSGSPPDNADAGPAVEDYTRNSRAELQADEAARGEPAGKRPGGYNNVWARQGEPAGAPFKPSGAARSWMPPAEDTAPGVTIVKGRKEEAQPIAWDLPKPSGPEGEAPGRTRRAVMERAGLSDAQAHVVETLDEADGPVEMPRAEIERIEEDFRTEFSLALIRLKGKREEGISALEKMAEHPGPFAVEHKFMFTDCGLALRKRNFYALANKFHERARKLSPEDEHVLFNQARVMYESGRIDKARAFLQLALDMVPGFGAAKDFLAFIDGPNKR